MESNYDRDFEQYVKENADQYRMFPSEKVWKGVHNSLHTRRKWYGLGLSLLLLLTGGSVTWVMTSTPAPKHQAIIAVNPDTPLALSPAEKALAETRSLNKILSFNAPSVNSEVSTVNGSTNDPVQEYTFLDYHVEAEVDEQVNQLEYPALLTQKIGPLDEQGDNLIINSIRIGNFSLTGATPSSSNSKNGFDRTPAAVNNYLGLPAKNKRQDELFSSPLTIESVVNSYRFKPGRKRISWQFFITPTISYRKLSVNKGYDNLAPSAFPGSPAPASPYPFAHISDVNKAVTHKPDIGLQFGLSGRYPIGHNLKIRGGVQLNINRYDIKAFAHNGETATINLNNGTGVPANSVSAWAYYRNYNGYKTDWLKNYYVSVSVPLGLELKLVGNKKTNLGIAGTIQPTYILKDRAYLISTDYKNYAEVPWLVRHTNISGSFETFVNLTSGRTQWQIGPQVRYQMLSSFNDKYPVKENLFDFGLKVGVTLNQ